MVNLKLPELTRKFMKLCYCFASKYLRPVDWLGISVQGPITSDSNQAVAAWRCRHM